MGQELVFRSPASTAPIRRGDWKNYPDGRIVPSLTPPFMARLLGPDRNIRDLLIPGGPMGELSRTPQGVTIHDGGVVVKPVTSPGYLELATAYLERGFSYCVPCFGYITNFGDGKMALLSREVVGYNLESALVSQFIPLTQSERRSMWFQVGAIEGAFHSRGITIHDGSAPWQLINFMAQDEVVQFIDIDARCSRFNASGGSLTENERDYALTGRLHVIGARMGEDDYASFILGYMSGLSGKLLGIGDGLVKTAMKKFKKAWKESDDWLRRVSELEAEFDPAL